MVRKVRSDAYVEFYFIGTDKPFIVASGTKAVSDGTVNTVPTVELAVFKSIYGQYVNLLGTLPDRRFPCISFITIDGKQISVHFDSLRSVQFIGIEPEQK